MRRGRASWSRSTTTRRCRSRSSTHPPKTKARFAFFAGSLNACFEPESQRRTHAWFERHDPGRHTLTVVPNYGHLDIFMGAHAAQDVFPDIISELERS